MLIFCISDDGLIKNIFTRRIILANPAEPFIFCFVTSALFLTLNKPAKDRSRGALSQNE